MSALLPLLPEIAAILADDGCDGTPFGVQLNQFGP
jgi:hypothetical protein